MQTTATTLSNAGALPRRSLLRTSPARVAATLLALALMGAAAGPARAWGEFHWGDEHDRIRPVDTWMDGQLVDVQIRVDGEPAPLYLARGRYDRRYLQAFAGRNYSVVLLNNTGRRVAVLLAVDGLNAVSGEISSLRPTEGMYVLGPGEQATIRGWRTSPDEIRRFVFVDEHRSYAERTGQANSDMGWIRVLAFREQLTWRESRRPDWGRVRSGYRDSGPPSSLPQLDQAPELRAQGSKDEAAPAPTKGVPEARSRAMAPEAQDNLARGEENDGRSFPGTGWGERRQDHVNRVHFSPESVAVDHLIFRYEYTSGLRALGIIPVGRGWRDRLGDRDGDMGFAKPPRR